MKKSQPMTAAAFFARSPAFAKDCVWSPSSKHAVHLPLSLICQQWFRFISASTPLAAGYFSYQSLWWLRLWLNSPSKFRLPIRRLMYIYPTLKNTKNGRIIWQHQNCVARNHPKPCRRLRRLQRANIQSRRQAGLFLIVFALQIANDCHRILFSNI